jgi:stage V sporulation protein SpoVS
VTAASVDKLATSISNKTGADDEAIASGAALLLTFTNVKNGVGKGNDIFNQATQTAVDMAAAMNGGEVSAEGLKGANIQLGKALNDPIKGISALSKVGVSFTEQQKKQIKAMVKAGDVAGAQKLILKELGKEFGGQAAAATDPMVKLQTVLGNLAETLGAMVLPYVEKFSTKMAEVANWIGNNEGKVRTLGTVLGILGGAILAINVGMKIHTAVLALTSGAWRALATVMWANPVFIIAGIIIAIGLALVIAYKKVDWFRNMCDTAFHAIAGFMGMVKDFFVKHWDTIKFAMTKAVQVMGGAYITFANGVLGIIEGMLRAASKLPKWLGGGAFDGAADAVAKIRGGLMEMKAKLDALPTTKKMQIELDTANAMKKMRDVASELDKIKGVHNAYVNVNTRVAVAEAGGSRSLYGGQTRADGGPVNKGGTYLVGEEGPEVVTFGHNGYVHPNGSGGGGVVSGRGGGMVNLTVNLYEEDGTLKQKIRKMVRIGGGLEATFGRA